MWEGVFATWEEAKHEVARRDVELAREPLSYFDSQIWLQQQAKLASTQELGTVSSPNRPTSLPLVSSALGAKRILDFGGGSGWAYRKIFDPGMSRVTHYVVIELPSSVREFTRLSSDVLQFMIKEDASREPACFKADLLYSNSTIQYLPSIEDFLMLTRLWSPRAVLLDEVFWTSSDQDFFAIQVNTNEPLIARISSVGKLRRQIEALGYQQVLNVAYEGKDYRFREIALSPEGPIIECPRTLLFMRGAE